LRRETEGKLVDVPAGVEINGHLGPRYEEVLDERALTLLAMLHRKLDPVRRGLLEERAERVGRFAGGGTLDFLDETASVRDDLSWRVAPPAPGLVDRRVEITGPTDRKMAINALNSGARVWLADQEDANTPLWENVVQGQLNLLDAVQGSIEYRSPEGKEYSVTAERQPTIVVRPRGWHLPEKHVVVDGSPVSGGLLDFALYLTACGQLQIDRGAGPYFYLPKMESHREARLWNDAFCLAQEFLDIPYGTIRATALIETYPAAFEMEEILYELRDHSAGLNAGRWDYIFSVIKSFRTRGDEFLLPDRSAITMTVPFMRAYAKLLVHTCHKRGAHAIGGMSAFVPSRDAGANEFAFAKLVEDKTREANDGFDGSWVAHPGMVSACEEVFDQVLGDRPHQIDRIPTGPAVTASDLLAVRRTPGAITEDGLRENVSVGLQYVESWLRGVGAVAINGLMEDAATAEISRSQLWQWLHNRVVAREGVPVTQALIEQYLEEELAAIRDHLGEEAYAGGMWAQARDLMLETATADEFVEFLTLAAYGRLP
jgi:malate synthase